MADERTGHQDTQGPGAHQARQNLDHDRREQEKRDHEPRDRVTGSDPNASLRERHAHDGPRPSTGQVGDPAARPLGTTDPAVQPPYPGDKDTLSAARDDFSVATSLLQDLGKVLERIGHRLGRT